MMIRTSTGGPNENECYEAVSLLNVKTPLNVIGVNQCYKIYLFV